MSIWKIKSVVALLGAATLLQAFPQDADAFIFRWLRRRRAERLALYAPATNACATPAVTAFQPIVGGSNACNPCTTTQRVCSYCPQTTYRTVYRRVPVTVYRPVTTVDPCTGCPTTTMHPCTTTQQVAQRVPVTTYRQVCRVVQRPVMAASPVMQQQQSYSPMQQQSYSPMQSMSAPNCCNSTPSATYAPAPATQLSPSPATSGGPTTQLAPTPSGGSQNGAAGQQPTLPRSNYGNGQSGYGNGQSNGAQFPSPTQSDNPGGSSFRGSSSRTSAPQAAPQSYRPRVQNPDIRPLPDLERAPDLLNPDDRTASRSSIAPGTVVPISWQTPAETAETNERRSANPPANTERPKTRRLDDGGWRPARSF